MVEIKGMELHLGILQNRGRGLQEKIMQSQNRLNLNNKGTDKKEEQKVIDTNLELLGKVQKEITEYEDAILEITKL